MIGLPRPCCKFQMFRCEDRMRTVSSLGESSLLKLGRHRLWVNPSWKHSIFDFDSVQLHSEINGRKKGKCPFGYERKHIRPKPDSCSECKGYDSNLESCHHVHRRCVRAIESEINGRKKGKCPFGYNLRQIRPTPDSCSECKGYDSNLESLDHVHRSFLLGKKEGRLWAELWIRNQQADAMTVGQMCADKRKLAEEKLRQLAKELGGNCKKPPTTGGQNGSVIAASSGYHCQHHCPRLSVEQARQLGYLHGIREAFESVEDNLAADSFKTL